MYMYIKCHQGLQRDYLGNNYHSFMIYIHVHCIFRKQWYHLKSALGIV